jgi:hypothetical protein
MCDTNPELTAHRCAAQGWSIADVCAHTERTYQPAQFLLGENDADRMQEMEDVSVGRRMLFLWFVNFLSSSCCQACFKHPCG